ncbi:hypothetical protein BS50DRAFT_477535, partial [Corynespora cassiicola Philippines]
MAEYWKSTPKYWCKFCSVYVKDTKFERQQHEATGRHQGSIQRSLRNLHRDQEIEKRKQQQAKDEVARLNGLVGSSSAGSSSTNAPAAVGARPVITKEPEKQATVEDRKRQWAQLAAMGIAIPEQARGDLAMAGEWKVVEQRVIGEIGDDGEFKPALSKGVHKRKLNEDEEEELAAAQTITKKKGWGKTFKSFPGKAGSGGDDDLDALFSGVKKPKIETEAEEATVKTEAEESQVKDEVKDEDAPTALHDIPTEEEAAAKPAVKQEEGGEASTAAPKVVFKKRKK